MKHLKVLIGSIVLGSLVSVAHPAYAAAVNYRPTQPTTITYSSDFEGSSTRPIVGAVLAGTMRVTVYPSGIISGTYVTEQGGLLPVNGGLETNGNVWLDIGQRTQVTGYWHSDGSITGYTYGPPALDHLAFNAKATNIQH